MKHGRRLRVVGWRVGAALFLLGGHGWHVYAAPPAEAADAGGAEVDDEPAAHALYDGMIEALHKAHSLSYSCRYERITGDLAKSACTYRVWLKKPNCFRMETQGASGKPAGVLIGDGESLWIYWPNGRPRWKYVDETDADEQTRFTSYMTKPATQRRHSIWHEAAFLGGGMSFPILDMSTFHGHVDPIAEHLDGVRSLGEETAQGEVCDKIEVSFVDGQRRWLLWLSRRNHLPRKLKETTRISYDVVTNEEWSNIAVNDELPDALFAWQPPPDWHEWKLPDDEDRMLKPGAKAPDFELSSVDGGRIRLSDFRGKKVWLCFWRVGCPPCLKETPYLQSLYEKYRGGAFVVIGVNVADDREIVLNYLRKEGVTFPNILDVSDAGENVERTYGGGTVPMNYLLDADGIVVDAWVEHSETRARTGLKRLGLE